MARKRIQKYIDLSYGFNRVCNPLLPAFDAANGADWRYPSFERFGSDAVKERFAELLEDRCGLQVDADEILVFKGRSNEVMKLLFAICTYQHYSTCMAWNPWWFGYPNTSIRGGISTMILRKLNGPDYQPDADFVRDTAEPTGLILINDVINPLGTMLTTPTLRAIGEAALRRPEKPVVLEDNHYFFAQFNGRHSRSIASVVPELWARRQYIGFTATRLAFDLEDLDSTFVWAPRPIIEAILTNWRLTDFYTTPDCNAALDVCLGNEGEEHTAAMMRAVSQNHAALTDFLARESLPPLYGSLSGGTNALMNISAWGLRPPRGQEADTYFADLCRTRLNVDLLPGNWFAWDGEPAIRFNLAGAPPTLFKEALERMKMLRP